MNNVCIHGNDANTCPHKGEAERCKVEKNLGGPVGSPVRTIQTVVNRAGHAVEEK